MANLGTSCHSGKSHSQAVRPATTQPRPLQGFTNAQQSQRPWMRVRRACSSPDNSACRRSASAVTWALRQQIDSVGSPALPASSPHQHIRMRADGLACRRYDRRSLRRQLDDVGCVDRIAAARFQLDEGQAPRPIAVHPINPCRDPDGPVGSKQPFRIGELRRLQLRRQPSVRVSSTMPPSNPPHDDQGERDQRCTDAQQVNGHGLTFKGAAAA